MWRTSCCSSSPGVVISGSPIYERMFLRSSFGLGLEDTTTLAVGKSAPFLGACRRSPRKINGELHQRGNLVQQEQLNLQICFTMAMLSRPSSNLVFLVQHFQPHSSINLHNMTYLSFELDK